MNTFDWDKHLSVNHPEIDSHHQKLLQLFNEVGTLIDAAEEDSKNSTMNVINELSVYTVFHFKEEEKLMEAGNYPKLEEHKRMHAKFIKKVNELKENYLNNDPLVNYDLYNYLSEWIVNHILQVDSQYKGYI